MTKANLWYLWRPVVTRWKAAGGRDLDLYELRHAAATMLLERGVSAADVAVQLGHTDGGALVLWRATVTPLRTRRETDSRCRNAGDQGAPERRRVRGTGAA